MKTIKEEWNERVNLQELAYRIAIKSNLYSASEDFQMENGTNVELLGERIRINWDSKFAITTGNINNERHLAINADGIVCEASLGLMELMEESKWFNVKYGFSKPLFGVMSDRNFYKIRSWMMLGLPIEKIPDGITADDTSFYGEDGSLLFTYFRENCQYVGGKGLMEDNRLCELVRNSESRRVVADSILRTGIDQILNWRFKTVSSIMEHHFTWNHETELVECKILNGTDVKSYSIGKGLKRIAVLMGCEEPSTDMIKKVGLFVEGYGKGTLEVVGGKDIPHFYLDEQMDKNQRLGSLTGGCMRWEQYSDSIENIYSGNASMLILRSASDSTKLLGRANLWILNDGRKFMDRIYCDESNIAKFKKWAFENGYITKRRQGYDHPATMVMEDGVSVETIQMQVSIDSSFCDASTESPRVPYMDTFKYLNATEGLIQNYAPEDGCTDMWYQMENTDGYCHRVDTDYSMSYQWEDMNY